MCRWAQAGPQLTGLSDSTACRIASAPTWSPEPLGPKLRYLLPRTAQPTPTASPATSTSQEASLGPEEALSVQSSAQACCDPNIQGGPSGKCAGHFWLFCSVAPTSLVWGPALNAGFSGSQARPALCHHLKKYSSGRDDCNSGVLGYNQMYPWIPLLCLSLSHLC